MAEQLVEQETSETTGTVETPEAPPETTTSEPPVEPVVESKEPDVSTKPADSKPVAVTEPETVTEAPTKAVNTELEDRLEKLKQKLTVALLGAHNVPDELKPLLPSDPDELETFLTSEEYQKLKAKLDKPSLPAPSATEPAPKPPEKTKQESERDALARIGRAFVGA